MNSYNEPLARFAAVERVDAETSAPLMRLTRAGREELAFARGKEAFMASGLKLLAAAGALVFALASAEAAAAQAARPKPESSRASLNEAIRSGAPASTTSLKFNEKGRWGVDVQVDEPLERDRKLRDLEAGAFFRVTPSVRVGGSVRLDDKLKPERITPDDRGARVRLETKFQF